MNKKPLDVRTFPVPMLMHRNATTNAERTAHFRSETKTIYDITQCNSDYTANIEQSFSGKFGTGKKVVDNYFFRASSIMQFRSVSTFTSQ